MSRACGQSHPRDKSRCYPRAVRREIRADRVQSYSARVELRHLRYFQAVAELLNFSRAAERMHVAQPALSRQIRDLESEIGARLFDRNRVRVQLTDAGRTFYSHACKVLAQVDLAVASVRETTRGTGGDLLLCNDWRLAINLIPATIAEFRRRYPRVEVVLQDVLLHQQLAILRAHRAHLGFLPRDEVAGREDLDFLSVARLELLAVVGSSHRLAPRRSVRIAELRDEKWLRLSGERSDGYNAFILQTCRSAGFTPRFHDAASTVEAMATVVASGYGVCLLPNNFSVQQRTMLRFLPTDCPAVELCAVWSRAESSLLLQQYLEILRRHVPVLPAALERRPSRPPARNGPKSLRSTLLRSANAVSAAK